MWWICNFQQPLRVRNLWGGTEMGQVGTGWGSTPPHYINPTCISIKWLLSQDVLLSTRDLKVMSSHSPSQAHRSMAYGRGTPSLSMDTMCKAERHSSISHHSLPTHSVLSMTYISVISFLLNKIPWKKCQVMKMTIRTKCHLLSTDSMPGTMDFINLTSHSSLCFISTTFLWGNNDTQRAVFANSHGNTRLLLLL